MRWCLQARCHAHINFTAATPVGRLVTMALVVLGAQLIPLFNVLMFRNVDDNGNTIHEVPANVLEAIQELEGVA